MARLIQPANTGENKQGLDDYTPIPPDKYPMVIVESKFKPTKAKTGHYLELKHKIIDGEYKGRLLWNRLNLDNPNPTAVEIANKTLNTICQACNKVGVQDSEELHGIPFIGTVKLTEATPTNPASNEIKFYEPMEGNVKIDTSKGTEPAEDKTIETSKKKSKLPWE